MNRKNHIVLAALPLAALVGLGAAARPQQKTTKATQSTAGFERDVAPLVAKYCVPCHKAPNGTAGVSLNLEKTFQAALKNRAVWDKVGPAVLENRMPPADMPQPTAAERERIGHTLESLFSQVDCQLNDPGRVTMRRLNRAEYNNTIRDLLGVTLRPADEFPNDDVGYGFDNIGDVLSISPLLMEKYLSAAEKVAEEAVVPPGAGAKPIRVTARQLAGLGGGGGGSSEGFELGRTGDTATASFDFPVAGTYTLRIEAYEQHAEPRATLMGVALDGKQVQVIEVPATVQKPQLSAFTLTIDQPGKHKISATFLNNNDRDPQDLPFRRKQQDRNLYINYIELQPPASVKRGLSFALPTNDTDAAWDAAAHAVLDPLAKRAFRRPPTLQEKNKLVALTHLAREAKKRDEFPEGIQLAVRAILSSPSFLFRPEPDAKPDDPTARRLLNDYELATRLSYFLWSSMPDDELLRVADSGKLKDPAVLVAQARRMMRDPKAAALAENFAGQWLQLRKLAAAQPGDPAFSPALRNAMETETLRFFTGVVQEDRSVLEFLDADYSYVNAPLAKFYGLPEITGEGFQRVKLPAGQRGGILSMASVLTLTSNPSRTSPVKRGKWVLDNLLGTPPPPPPPNVPLLEAQKGAITAETLRKRLEIHRTNPACANCHTQMDAIGLALENYDLVGRWRTDDGGKPIDTAGVLPDGSKFSGPSELKKVLLKKKTQFTHTLTDRLLTYALGRGVERTDKCNLDSMTKSVENKGYKFSAIVEAVVTSVPFRERRGDESGKKSAGH
ncbi:DUF1592 domain-containing protein [Armatimonas rosea]|uniref:DUF1592 domain-containing protein n=1 Tax=Armatimonas rosea TaxID=685828 RepID=A0A7W9SMZ3_ARMRO|nr:DUF1592 domain-containing protein [Armatimonas rosea]MBB6049596.1 hypothetical protein [Armatimonas rosea]